MIPGKVKDGALYFNSASEWLKYLATFEGKDVEVTVRQATWIKRIDPQALRLAAIEVCLHLACWCAPKGDGIALPMCDRCVKAFDALAVLVGMKTPEMKGAVNADE